MAELWDELCLVDSFGYPTEFSVTDDGRLSILGGPDDEYSFGTYLGPEEAKKLRDWLIEKYPL